MSDRGAADQDLFQIWLASSRTFFAAEPMTGEPMPGQPMTAALKERCDELFAAWSRFARVYAERLLDIRNRLMVARMMPRLGEGNALVAVGALHLPGRRGILNLLAEEGYHIARVY